MTTDFTVLPAAGVRAELSAVSVDARATFGPLDARQFNWRASDATWSVGQCLVHLLTVNRSMCVKMGAALDSAGRRSIAQRLPFLPGLLGPMLVRSQSPVSPRRIKTAQWAQPAASAIDRRVLGEFTDHNSEMSARLRALDERDLARVIMVSPFASFVVYSLLDGWRLIAAHNWRHVEQARRVIQSPAFPT
jgi:hypothetical protein